MGLIQGQTRPGPRQDCHAIGELQHFLLLKVSNDTSQFSLGRIGLDGRQFCRSTTCRAMSHCTKHFFLECQEGYFICATGQSLTRPQAVYRAPFLDALRLTPEVWAIVAGSGESSNKTTREWEEFIL